jgi:hypothetical protein
MGKVDNIQEAENNSQTKAQDGVKHTVIEPQHDLRHDRLK